MAVARRSAAPVLPSLAERWYALRNRLLANPGFQRRAAAFPLTRPVAGHRARTLFDLCAGFVYSQILFACVQLRVFERLRDTPLSLEALAARIDLPVPGTRRLVEAAVALRLLERRRDNERGQARYGLAQLGAAMLGNPGAEAMIRHHAMLYADLADPVALLRGERTTELARYWPYAGTSEPRALENERVEAYTALMAASQQLIAEDIIAAYPLRRHRRILDVGGGDGTFLSAVAARAPDLELTLFDLPAVAERARQRFEEEGIASRATTFGGDFFADPLPEGADLLTLIRIVHDHDDAGALALLKAARRALPPDGTLLIAEPMASTPGAEPVGDAYFGFYLLAMGSGRPRSARELGQILREAGFAQVRQLRTRRPLLTSLVRACGEQKR